MKADMSASIHKALENQNLAGILDRWNYPATRAKAFEGVDFEALRSKIAGIKGDAAGRLDELANTFKKNAEANGIKVFRASSAEAARQYIANLCKEKGVKKIVKSKSMATEEIHLNHFLDEFGIQSDETDLGEWICQLAHQTPSHMVMPALHLTKEEISDLFAEETKQPLDNDIQKLVKVARAAIREKFFEADMGISGANIAIAETGSIVICTNEGNARLVTTLPKVHVALVGLEKLVPNYTDAAPILAALPRNATSQLLTSYVSFISAPTQNDDGSMKEVHIVLMDNNRIKMAEDPKFKEALQCIRCAACLNVCPVYRLVTGHVFGDIYTGGIGTILTAWFNELKSAEDIQALCIGCDKCKEICPGKIDIPGLILEIRRRAATKEGLPFIYKSALQVINNRKVFHTMLRTASVLQKPFVKEGFIRHLPMFLSGLSEYRSLPSVAAVPFRDIFKTIKQPKCTEKAAFYAGCALDFVYPDAGVAIVKILNKAGIEVLFPEEQSCCGIPHWGSGSFDMAADAAERNILPLLEGNPEYVVVSCASCTTALKKEWAKILKEQNREALIPAANKVAAKTYMFTELVDKLIKEKRLTPKEGIELHTLTYHDSCHAKRHVGISKEPRDALSAAGYEIKEMNECDTCCGMGGSYTIKQPEISMQMLKRKLENIEATGAEFVSAECPGCLIQLRGGLDKSGSKVKAIHPAELMVDKFK
ncbi:L-lactate dehydrogenase (quinone) large subunit LdhH [Sulfurospirillum multivorans]|uniref:Oxidoreductase, YkgE/YkgF-like n=2 Tax=Sulfurospirillum multivorans TaxID=66821 RepID=A0AA86ALB8_SULMK|nr:LUD domain-containing protein [Sulfurospirillum multivorans]AHJ12579.1 putative oxidoreductase, YkgE/YkgF-like [Sulfurospirillum multivorans DSM 12446]QEH06074.1 putative oxidoreductase, YkgE/YkgF-like [Sulfurospirillum multivorans]